MSAVFIATGGNPFIVNANLTNYLVLSSCQVTATVTEANEATVWREAGAFSNYYCNVTANTVTANSTFAIRNGGVTGNNSVTYGNSVTGEMFDTTHTDAVAAGNIVNHRLVTGATGTSISGSMLGLVFSPTTATNTVNKYACTTAITSTVNQTFYEPPAGASAVNVSVEANTQFQNQATATLQNLCVVVSANTATVGTVTSRIGAAPGNLSVSIGSGVTGNLEDTTHSDSLAVGNLFNYRVNTTATTTITINNVAASYLTTTGQTHYINAFGTGTTFASGATPNLAITGRVANVSSTESQASCQTGMSFTASQLECYVISIVSTPSVQVFFRIGGASGNQSLTPVSGATRYTDSTHTDNLAPANEINTRVVVAVIGGTSMTFGNVGFLATLALPARQVIVDVSVNAVW